MAKRVSKTLPPSFEVQVETFFRGKKITDRNFAFHKQVKKLFFSFILSLPLVRPILSQFTGYETFACLLFFREESC
jgi:hypothetical protein